MGSGRKILYVRKLPHRYGVMQTFPNRVPHVCRITLPRLELRKLTRGAPLCCSTMYIAIVLY